MFKDISNWIYFNNCVRELKNIEGYDVFKIKQDYFGRMYFVINIDETFKNDQERAVVFSAQLKPLFTFIREYSIPFAELIRIDYQDINNTSRLYIFEPTFDYFNFDTFKFLIRTLAIFSCLELFLFNYYEGFTLTMWIFNYISSFFF